VTTAGTVSHTGVGGLTLGAGFGRLARRHGLALDNVRAVDIVTADGRLLHASANENPDLYWAVRGGGGNFGVVTGFEFGLHPMQRQVVGGDIVYPISRGREILDLYRDFSLAAPDDLYTDWRIFAPAGGKDGIAAIHVCYSGPAGDADRVLAPIRKLGTPLHDGIKAIDYTAIQRSWDTIDPRNDGEYLKSGFIDGFEPALAEAIIKGFAGHPDRDTTLFFQHCGGAIGRVPVEATAFPHRRATHNMLAAVSWPLGQDGSQHVKYLKEYWDPLEKYTDGYYTNENSDEPQRVVDENYQSNLPLLVTLKNKYDPTNLFRLNANIKPTV
jgi:FAD/FMN-containing dehydrogenase